MGGGVLTDLMHSLPPNHVVIIAAVDVVVRMAGVNTIVAGVVPVKTDEVDAVAAVSECAASMSDVTPPMVDGNSCVRGAEVLVVKYVFVVRIAVVGVAAAVNDGVADMADVTPPVVDIATVVFEEGRVAEVAERILVVSAFHSKKLV